MESNNGKYSADLIADWLLSKSEMSPKKLQKMLYYCYSWVLTLMNEQEDCLKNKLFDENFEAWVHGPVIPSIYAQYRDNGYNDIPQKETSILIDDEDILDILEQVYAEYGHYTGNELESITHQEEPWLDARKDLKSFEASNVVITDSAIFNYYIQRVG